MNKFWKIFFKEIIRPYPVPNYIVFNVDNFNVWFNSKDNGATYANSGIFLRTDKLSMSHVYEYLELCYGIGTERDQIKTVVFYEDIRKDWRAKLV